jgi:peroxiredoxin
MTNNEGNRNTDGGLSKPLIAFIIIAVIAVVAVIVFSQKSSYEPVGAGADAVDFTLPGLDGKPVSLKDFRGKVVFLNFWATWCKPCEDEMPSIEALYNGLKGQQFEIVAVSIDSDKVDTVKKYVAKFGLTFRVLHDKGGKIKELYKTTGVPETFIIDQNGVIAEKIWGPRDWSNRGHLGMIFDLLKNGPKQKQAYKPDRTADRR